MKISKMVKQQYIGDVLSLMHFQILFIWGCTLHHFSHLYICEYNRLVTSKQKPLKGDRRWPQMLYNDTMHTVKQSYSTSSVCLIVRTGYGCTGGGRIFLIGLNRKPSSCLGFPLQGGAYESLIFFCFSFVLQSKHVF